MKSEIFAAMRGALAIVVVSTLWGCVGPPHVAAPSGEEHAGIRGGSGLQLGPARATMVPQITVVYRKFTYGGHSIREQSEGARKTIFPTNGVFLIVETEVRRDRSRRDGRGFQFGTDTSVLTDHAGNMYPACGVCTKSAEGYESICTATTGKPSDIPDEGWTCILYFDVPKGIRPRAIRLTPGTPAVEVTLALLPLHDVAGPPSGGTDLRERNWPPAIAALLGVDADGIDESSSGRTDAVLAPMVVLGPGFFQQYMRMSALKQIGTATQFRLPLGDPPKVRTFEGRTLLGPSRGRLLTVPEFRAVMAKYREGRLRQATPEERAIFYALIPFEIEGQPVHVLQASEGRLLVYLDDEKRVFWLEYLDQWHTGND